MERVASHDRTPGPHGIIRTTPMGCSNLFCLPPEVVELAYFCVLSVANILNCLTAVASIYLILRRACREAPKRDSMACTGPISVVIPCYLPNEENLIVATVMHIATCLEWPGRLTLYVVYNTPHRMPAAELALRALDGRTFPGGRTVVILEAEGSTSKAENLNFCISRLTDPHIALYDADHRCRAPLSVASTQPRPPFVMQRRVNYYEERKRAVRLGSSPATALPVAPGRSRAPSWR
eukprot:scaffold6934_cov121-Isochrysis_galbana.AAC.3